MVIVFKALEYVKSDCKFLPNQKTPYLLEINRIIGHESIEEARQGQSSALPDLHMFFLAPGLFVPR